MLSARTFLPLYFPGRHPKFGYRQPRLLTSLIGMCMWCSELMSLARNREAVIVPDQRYVYNPLLECWPKMRYHRELHRYAAVLAERELCVSLYKHIAMPPMLSLPEPVYQFVQ